MSAAQDIRNFCESLALRATGELAKELQEKIVTRTPIDTGRAQASWRINPGEADPTTEPALANRIQSTGLIEIADPQEHPLYRDQALAVARSYQQRLTGRDVVIVISNNLYYIEELENGSSQQAPAGMVAVTVSNPQQMQAAMDRIVAAL